MTDRELLEKAAKAVRQPIEFDDWSGKPVAFLLNDEYVPAWNPLEDPGLALRLAVALRMDIEIRVNAAYIAVAAHREPDQRAYIVEQPGDSCASLCRAIVRAAAAMADQPAEFTPQEMFAPGAEGYFQDAEGMIPVTAIGQRVGFVQHRAENMPTFERKPNGEK